MSPPSFPELYERELVAPLFRPWAEILLEMVHLNAGDRVLDIACGTGIVARLARQSGAVAVVGVDASADMLEVAHTVAPDIDWRQGSAGGLPLRPAELFDVVFCQQGLQFFPDRLAAVHEMLRALAPTGRLAVSTWRPVDECPLLVALQRVAESHVGPLVDQRHAFGHASMLEQLLRECGVRDVRLHVRSQTVRFRDAGVFARLNAAALVGMSAAGKKMSAEDRALAIGAIVADSADALRSYTDDAGLAFSIGSNVATGRR